MNNFKITMYEDEWNVYLVEDNDDVIADDSAGAVTNFELKELYFRKGFLSEAYVRHELWHVAMGYCYIADTHEITLTDMEEITCAIFADRGERLLKLSNFIYNKLKEMNA